MERGSGKANTVMFSTQESVGPVRDWCERSCSGDWSLAIEEMDLASGRKVLRLDFDNPHDKAAFVAQFGRAAAPAGRLRSTG